MGNDGRLHIRLPKDLKEFLERYATKKNTTASALIVRLLTALREKEDTDVDAEQI